jgi:VanZ family protein
MSGAELTWSSQSILRKFLYWLPPFFWMAAIFYFSTDALSSGNTGGILITIVRWLIPDVSGETFGLIHFLVRKAAHFTVYAILALLTFRALRSGAAERWQRRWALWSFLLVSVYALLDEYHQSFTRTRTGTPVDSFIDMTGGAFALMCLWLGSKRKRN